MAVTSRPMGGAPRKSIDWPILFGKIGMWLTVGAFGIVFWAINGGFSVIGLGVIAGAFNEAGQLAWAALSAIQVRVPVQVPGLPSSQPLIPWLGVVAGSLLQISVAWLKLSGRSVPRWLVVFAFVVSVYDYATTAFGLGTVSWLAAVHPAVRWLLAIPLTFVLEIAIGWLLPKPKRASHADTTPAHTPGGA